MSKETEKLRKQISEARSRIRQIKESKAPAVRSAGVGILIESELDKASLMLSAEAITDRLTDMAEKVAKIEPDELMKMDAALKAQVGDEAAARFYSKTVEAVRMLLDQIKTCRDSVSREIQGLKDGTVPNDMAMTEPTAGAEMDDAASATDLDMAPPEGEDADLAADIPMDGEDDAAGLGPEIEPEPALGRDRKDALAESVDPDALVLESFKSQMRESGSAAKAARAVAEMFDIDVSDVRDIVTEAARTLQEKKKSLPKGFVPFKKGGKKEAVKEADKADCDAECKDDKKGAKKGKGFVPFKKGEKVDESFQPMSYEGWIKAVDRKMMADWGIPLESEVGEEDARRFYKASQECNETVDEFVKWYAEKYDLIDFGSSLKGGW